MKLPILDNKVYDLLKWIALILLPALGTLYFALAAIWGFPYAEQVVGTIVAFDTFLGVLLQISTNQYNQNTQFFDNFGPRPSTTGTGAYDVERDEQGTYKDQESTNQVKR
jgi:hypothetical protein